MTGRITTTDVLVIGGGLAGERCAIEAAASGSTSNRWNTSATGCSYASSSIAIACSAGNGGTASCSLASSSAMSGGSRSRRVEIAWPNLTNIGPSSSRAGPPRVG